MRPAGCPSGHDRLLKIDRVPLSVICNNATDNIKERSQNRLLRPIFINGVEVGFAYAKGANAVKKLSARGITICLWYFISRGHQAQALLPLCFKSYPDKSNGWDEIMALYRINLIEFTPGFGSDKYVEVNRIMATRTRQYGGCMVARSQMHNIVEQDPMLDRTVEEKLLMPSFNGNDIIFPVDGPLGRHGCTLAETLVCPLDNLEWSRCVSQQMSLRDQRIWMTNLANIMQNPQWITAAGKVCRQQSLNFVIIPPGYPPLEKPLLQLHPPETNPPENRGFSKLRRWTRQSRFPDSSGYSPRSSYNNNNYMDHFSSRRRSWTQSKSAFNANHYFAPSYRRNPRKYGEKKVTYIGHPNSIYRLDDPSRNSLNNDSRSAGSNNRPKSEAVDKRTRANVLAYSKTRPIHHRKPNSIAGKHGLKKLPDILEENDQEEKKEMRDKGNNTKDKDEKQDQEQDEEDEEEEKEDKQLLEGNDAFPKATKIHSTNGKKNAGVLNDAEKDQFILRGISLINNETVICSTFDDADSVAVAMTSCDKESDLINFSDSELENGNDKPLFETRTLM
ncbi:Zc3h12a-like Ribonuclease NYN domain family protein [Acanthocheilonema viteae]